MPDFIAVDEINSQVMTSENNIKTQLNGVKDDNKKNFIINAILAEDSSLNDWGFKQNGIGNAINDAFYLNSSILANCNTVNEIANNTSAISAILTNYKATLICSKNLTLAAKLTDEIKLSAGYGYVFFNVGDIVTLKYNGTNTSFRVVRKSNNKITLLSEKLVTSQVWNSNGRNNYTTSSIRSYLNSTVLSGFSQAIQSAIIAPALSCHDYTTAKTVNDKIWLPSFTEMGYPSNSYAPVEGSAFEYFADNNNSKRIKSYSNGSNSWWWLRTPYTSGSSGAWGVSGDGGQYYLGVAGSYGVAFAFLI